MKLEYDYDRQKEKKTELVNQFKQISIDRLSFDDKSIINQIVKESIKLSPPEKEIHMSHFITLNSFNGMNGSKSTKPGNIQFNIRNFIKTITSSALSIQGALQTPWSLVLVAIILWDDLYSNAQIELTENEAVTIWVMWKYASEDRRIDENIILPSINKEMEEYNKSMSKKELEFVLENLKNIQAIEKSKMEPSKWWLREWVSLKYSERGYTCDSLSFKA